MNVPPPLYSQEDPSLAPNEGPSDFLAISNPQLNVVPTSSSFNFQSGYLGAEGERAAIEGELQIKDAQPGLWNSITLSLTTVERAHEYQVELGSSKIVLCQLSPSASAFPSSIPFSIPLPNDTPQTIETPSSSLTHTLTAVLHPRNPETTDPMVRDLIVHTRRYSSHTSALPIDPQTHRSSEPVAVNVEIPRAQFHTDERIPVYITIPPPSKDILVSKELRLRNVKAELIRTTRVEGSMSEGKHAAGGGFQDTSSSPTNRAPFSDEEGPSTARPKSGAYEKAPVSDEGPSGTSHTSTIAKSGAGCRFHPTKPIKLRLLLHQTSPPFPGLQALSDEASSSDRPTNTNFDADCPAITQSTLLHNVSFALHVIVSFLDMKNHIERSTTVIIPVTIAPPPARLPEVEDSVGVAYQKKHDRPPTRTVRHEEYDHAPSYPDGEGEAGPSGIQQGAPPPFEERDAPPPFFLPSATEASSSSRLPTFLESEEEVIFPSSSIAPTTPHGWEEIPGEGVHFGFKSTAQFDGHLDGVQQSDSLPTHELVAQAGALNSLSHDIDVQLVLQPAVPTSMEEMPPPPPAMDDPSDPPPSIDSDFRSPSDGLRNQGGQSPPPIHAHYDHRAGSMSPPPPRHDAVPASGNYAPPPYAIPDGQPTRHEDQVATPPPYVDFGSPHGQVN